MKKYIPRVIGAYINTLARIRPEHASRIAFKLFCRPMRLPITEKHKEFLEQARYRLFPAREAAVQVYSWGNGPRKIMFLHGWQSHSYRWKAYVDSLSKEEFTIYAVDAPGHGLSPGSFLSVPLYAGVIRDLVSELGPFEGIVSHSIGSFSLLYAIYQHSSLPVERLVVMAAPGEATDFLESFRSTLGASARTMELLRHQFMRRYNVTPDHFSTDRFVESMTIPGLIIHDEEDNDAPFYYSQLIHRKWKGSKLIATRGFGHNLRSPEVVSSLADYLTAGPLRSVEVSRELSRNRV